MNGQNDGELVIAFFPRPSINFGIEKGDVIIQEQRFTFHLPPAPITKEKAGKNSLVDKIHPDQLNQKEVWAFMYIFLKFPKWF